MGIATQVNFLSAWAEIRAPPLIRTKNAECCAGATKLILDPRLSICTADDRPLISSAVPAEAKLQLR